MCFVKCSIKKGRQECTICIASSTRTDAVEAICGHRFHRKCLEEYQETKQFKCPNCRIALPSLHPRANPAPAHAAVNESFKRDTAWGDAVKEKIKHVERLTLNRHVPRRIHSMLNSAGMQQLKVRVTDRHVGWNFNFTKEEDAAYYALKPCQQILERIQPRF